MAQILLAVVGGSLLGLGESIQCSTNSIGFDWTGASASSSGSSSSTSGSWQSPFISSECEQDICTATEYDIDIDVTVTPVGIWSWFVDEWTWSASYGLDAAFCGNEDVCGALAGGNEGCRAIQFDYSQWYPRSCNNETDYDATIMDFNITYKYGCCTTDNCNQNYDFSICEYNDDLGNYISELYECWNGVRRDLMKYLICDTSGNRIYEFEGNCRDGEQWDSDNDNCVYTLTCSDTFQRILTNFGECACSAATDNDYPGLVISEIMETQWNSYCPNVELSCSSDGSVIIDLTRYYVYWTFLLDISIGDIDDDFRLRIIIGIATAARVDSSLVTIVSEERGDTSGRRRLSMNRRLLSDGTTVTVQVETETEDDADTVENNLEEDGDDEVTSSTNVTSSGGSGTVSTEDTDDGESAGYKLIVSLSTFAIFFTLCAIVV